MKVKPKPDEIQEIEITLSPNELYFILYAIGKIETSDFKHPNIEFHNKYYGSCGFNIYNITHVKHELGVFGKDNNNRLPDYLTQEQQLDELSKYERT